MDGRASGATDERPMIVRLRNLEKTYDIGTPRETKALRGINLEISQSEIAIIFGSSGSGKSTLLNILAGLDQPTGGEVWIDDKNLATMTPHELATYHQFKVGMVFQAYNLVDSMTVMQNITMPARLAGFKRREFEQRGQALLKQFDLVKLADHLPGECSGGQQQRVGIMRAFMNRPAMIIADEPTGNLDSANSEHIMKLFKQLNEETKTTILIVTHDPALFAIADRVVHVLDGKVVKQTILTTKAKVNPAMLDTPVEYKLTPEEHAAFIDAFGGTKAPAAPAGEAVARQQADRVLAKQQQDLHLEYQRLEREYQETLAAVQAQEKRSEVRGEQVAKLRQEQERVQQAQRLLARERQLLAQEKQEVQFAKQFIANEQKRLAAEELRLAAALRQPLQDQSKITKTLVALRREQAKLLQEKESLAVAQGALARERARFEQDVQQRIEVATNIVDHEREQLETERQEQEAAAAQRAADMDRKLAAARALIKREAARLSAEQHLLARQRQVQEKYVQQLEAEKDQLKHEQQRLLKQLKQAGPVSREKRTHRQAPVPQRAVFDTVWAQRFSLSATAQRILESVATILTPAQHRHLSRIQIFRMIEAIEFRLYDIYTAAELQSFLDRPQAEGGAGLYRQTAKHVADSIEAMIRLGTITKPENPTP